MEPQRPFPPICRRRQSRPPYEGPPPRALLQLPRDAQAHPRGLHALREGRPQGEGGGVGEGRRGEGDVPQNGGAVEEGVRIVQDEEEEADGVRGVQIRLLLQREVPARRVGEAQGRVQAGEEEEQANDQDEGLREGGD